MTSAMKERVLVTKQARPVATGAAETAMSRHAAKGAWAGAAVLLAGSFIDLGILWGLQLQPNPQSEFIATMNTLESYTRFSIGIALVYAALYMGRSTSVWMYRAAAAFMIVLGIAAAVLGLVLVNDYFAISRLAQTPTDATNAMVVTVTKGLLLSGLFTVVFTPLGILGLRRPRAG